MNNVIIHVLTCTLLTLQYFPLYDILYDNMIYLQQGLPILLHLNYLANIGSKVKVNALVYVVIIIMYSCQGKQLHVNL